MMTFLFTLIIILLLLGLPIFFVVKIGKAIASGLDDSIRKIVGGVILLIGIFFAIYGISSFNSASSQILRAIGKEDIGGIVAMCLGFLSALIGIVVILFKGTKHNLGSTTSVRVCPYCAEPIQLNAKICRYCGKDIALI